MGVAADLPCLRILLEIHERLPEKSAKTVMVKKFILTHL